MTDIECAVNLLKLSVTQQHYSVPAPADMEWLWNFAALQMIGATIAEPLLSSGIPMDEDMRLRWRERLYKNKRKTMMYDVERKNIYRALEKHGIWHAPLKGIVVGKLYPSYGTREFADNDILIDSSMLDEVERAMADLDYEFDTTSIVIHYTFHKPPVFNFELHHKLLVEKPGYDVVLRYFNQITSRLITDENNVYCRSMTAEDSYLYIIAHAYRHYLHSGTGVRILSDVYVYKKSVQMDEHYLKQALEEMELSGFASSLEDLSESIFGREGVFRLSDLTEEQQSFLNSFIESGAYGTAENYMTRKLGEMKTKSGRTSKLKYYKARLFPPIEPYRKKYPTLYKHKALHPIFYIYRPIKGVFRDGKRIAGEISFISRAKKK